jgi:hypothetical protein
VTAAENIRAYLTARRNGGITAPVVAFVTDPASPEEHLRFVELREVDLEVVLQILDLLAGVGVRETPAEITTHEQVFDLPEYTVLQDSTGQVWQRYSADPAEGGPWETMNDSRTFSHHAIQLPARELVPRENT